MRKHIIFVILIFAITLLPKNYAISLLNEIYLIKSFLINTSFFPFIGFSGFKIKEEMMQTKVQAFLRHKDEGE